MKTLKSLFTVLLCLLMVWSTILPTFAANTLLNHGSDVYCKFAITDSGLSEILVSYGGNGGSFTHITVETYIQKRSLGFIWTKIDNGQPNKTWVDTSTDNEGFFFHDLQINEKGTYRAVFKITFSGTGAEDDVIKDNIVATYK